MTEKIAVEVVNSNPKIRKSKIRESKIKTISFNFFSLDFFIILEVGLTTSDVIFSVIFLLDHEVFVLYKKLFSCIVFKTGITFSPSTFQTKVIAI